MTAILAPLWRYFADTSASFWKQTTLIHPVFFFEEWKASENEATGFPSLL
jgi:hypothetical protein